MNKKKVGSILIFISIITMIFLLALERGLSFLGTPSGIVCLGFLFIFFIFASMLVIGLILLFTGKKGPREKNDNNDLRRRCPKCNEWIDISKAVRPSVVRCEKCNEPVLLDIEEQNVMVQCPKCMTQQVQHIQSRPAKVPCTNCGAILVIPKKY